MDERSDLLKSQFVCAPVVWVRGQVQLRKRSRKVGINAAIVPEFVKEFPAWKEAVGCFERLTVMAGQVVSMIRSLPLAVLTLDSLMSYCDPLVTAPLSEGQEYWLLTQRHHDLAGKRRGCGGLEIFD